MKNLHSGNLGEQWMQHMQRGDWERAWQISDVMLELGRFRDPTLPRHLQAVWNGDSLSRRRVLVHCYHGLGDTIQFVRFAAALHDIAHSVVVWAQPKLIPVVRTVHGVDSVLPLHDGSPQVERDVDIEIMELPHALRITLDTLPARVPYLHVPARRSAGCDLRPRVGVVSEAGGWDPRRSVPSQLLQELMKRDDIAWRALQRGPAVARWRCNNAEVPHMADIADEAAELRALDLLITVDTLSAHLAGALGVRTWTLLPVDADWRWMQHRSDSPWYPTMRLFRQSHPGEWGAVLERVQVELGTLVARNIDCCEERRLDRSCRK